MANVVIYTRQFCGFCTAALGLLRQKGVSFEHFDATMDQALRREMVDRTGGQTFPQILIDGKAIGGCDELFALEESGELNALLNASHARILQDHDFHEFKISVKASDVFLTVAAYQQLADAIDCPLHLGITEAGGLMSGTIKSSIGLGSLLWAGIGDTIRVSLSADPVEEIKVGFDILKSLNLRHRGVNIISCPSCARQGFDVIKTVEILEERLAHVRLFELRCSS